MNSCFFLATLFLATGSPERAVWLCFGFYLLNVLVPIIPAVVIYHLFPEGKTKGAPLPQQVKGASNARTEPNDMGGSNEDDVGSSRNTIEGKLGGWSIKAVGAWGAYVTTFVLGYWAIYTTAVPLIKAVGGASVWTVESEFKLVDQAGREIQATVDKLRVEPPMVSPWGKRATIRLFSETLDPPDQIRMELEGYDKAYVDLRDAVARDGKIKLPPVTLTLLPAITTGTPPPTLPQGQGPAPLPVTQSQNAAALPITQ